MTEKEKFVSFFADFWQDFTEGKTGQFKDQIFLIYNVFYMCRNLGWITEAQFSSLDSPLERYYEGPRKMGRKRKLIEAFGNLVLEMRKEENQWPNLN